MLQSNELQLEVLIEGPGYSIRGVPVTVHKIDEPYGSARFSAGVGDQGEGFTMHRKSIREHTFTFPDGVSVEGVTEFKILYPPHPEREAA